MRKARFALAVLALVFSGLGCAGFRAPNAALEEWSPDYGYRPQNLRKHHPVGRVALLMAFSGGGTRRLYLQLLNPVNWFRMLTTLSRTELGIDRPLDIVVVDAQVNPKKRFDLNPSSPGLGELLGIITGSQLNLIEFGRRTFRTSPDTKMLLDRLEQ